MVLKSRSQPAGDVNQHGASAELCCSAEESIWPLTSHAGVQRSQMIGFLAARKWQQGKGWAYLHLHHLQEL